jgi:hypothetical protein
MGTEIVVTQPDSAAIRARLDNPPHPDNELDCRVWDIQNVKDLTALLPHIDELEVELRAAREVVAAAEKLETDFESDLDWLHENLIAALAAYRAVVGEAGA